MLIGLKFYLLETQGQSPELAINFHGSVAFIDWLCWNLWKDCSFTWLLHPFVAFEVEGDLQIRTPRPKQITHLEIQNPKSMGSRCLPVFSENDRFWRQTPETLKILVFCSWKGNWMSRVLFNIWRLRWAKWKQLPPKTLEIARKNPANFCETPANIRKTPANIRKNPQIPKWRRAN